MWNKCCIEATQLYKGQYLKGNIIGWYTQGDRSLRGALTVRSSVGIEYREFHVLHGQLKDIDCVIVP